MIKYSDNLVLEADGSRLKVIQSKDGCDFITYLEGVSYDSTSRVCLQTDRFILIEAEGLKSVSVEISKVTLRTADGEYVLPVMRERGLLLSEPPVTIPKTDPEFTWNYDFSSKSVNTTFSNDMGLAASLVVIGDNLVARSITNTLELYGDSSTAKFAITPKQFALCLKTGSATVKYWSSGEALITGSNGIEVAIKKTKQKIDVAGLESRLRLNSSLFNADLSSLKIKTLGKFVVEKLVLTFSKGKSTFITDSARKVIDCPDLDLDEPLSLEIMSKDLKYLVGKISVNTMAVNNQVRYVIRTEDKDKVIYVLTARATV